MRKTRVNKRKKKYSKKTSKAGRDYVKNSCKNGVTYEVLRHRGYIKELRNKYKKTNKNKSLPTDKNIINAQ
jgi:uncharacterized protein YutD